MATFEHRWLGMDGIFGGFVLGRVVDAAAGAADGFSPQAVTTHFVGAIRPGEVELVTETVHRGRTTASLRVELRQNGRTRVHAIASLVPTDQLVTWQHTEDPAGWGDPETLPTYVARHRPLPYSDHLDVRACAPHTLREGASAWVRMVRAPDTMGPHGVASIFLDVLPPGLFACDEPPFFVPTVDFTVHFSPQLADADLMTGWLHVTNRTLWTSEGFCVDESTLHDRDGRPLAQIRQGRAVRWNGP
jgi:acyl-CoA thioesterase